MENNNANTPKEMMQIDGSYGEGGGQIIRTALTLSLITQTPIHIRNIRAGRKKSGLLRQHLTCVKAAKTIGHATVTGAELGSTELTFTPHTLQAGNYLFEIGSAGSTLLVLQTVLPALMILDEASIVTITGGTHNPSAPPVEYIQNTFVPFLDKLGYNVTLTCEEAGFAPIGGGRIVCDIQPVSTKATTPFELIDRGDLLAVDAYSIVANVPFHVTERELASIAKNLESELAELGGLAVSKSVEYQSISQGNMAVAVVHSEHHIETFTVLGERKMAAEAVGKRLAGQVKRYLHHSACLDEYSADQFLLPLALTKGGTLTARMLSEHTTTQAYMIEKFLDVKIVLNDKQICITC